MIMEIKKPLRVLQAFIYKPKHLQSRFNVSSFSLNVLLLTLVVLGLMVGAGFWLTNVVEKKIDFVLAGREITVAPTPAPPVATVNRPVQFQPSQILRPVYGELLHGLGWQKHPQFGDWFFHDGLDLLVQSGEEIRAMAAGEVREIVANYIEESLGPQGYLVRVEHGSRAISEYIFSGQIMVQVGEKLEPAGLLGVVSSREDEKVAIHISLRQNGDPLDWLALLENRG